MPDPITLGGLCLGALTAVGGGIVGNRADSIFCKSVKTLSDEFLSAIKLPENHELLKGVAKAHRQALADMAETCNTQARDFRDRMIANTMIEIAKHAFECNEDMVMQTAQAMLHSLPAFLQSPGDGAASIRRDAILAEQCDGVIRWFEAEAKETLPDHFVAAFRSGAPNGRPAWWQVFQIRVSEMIKGDERFERILQATNLAELLGHAVTVERVVFGLRDGMDQVIESLAAVHDKLDGLGEAVAAGNIVTHKLVAGELDERLVTAVDADLMSEDQLARIYAKVAEKLGMEGAKAATQNIVEAAARSSDEVQDLLSEGKFVEAGIAQQRLAEAGDAKQAQLWRDTARIKVLTSIKEAITAYARAVELDPSDFGTWIELSRLHQAAGSLTDARRTAEAALQHSTNDRERAVAEHELGDIAVVEGKLDAAKGHFQSFLSASQAGADANPDDVTIQRDLSIGHEKLGDVAVAQGDLAGARTAYGAALAIRERLASSDPGNAEWQRDLFISHAKFAQFNEASGDVAGAIAEFEAGEAILVALLTRVGDHPGFVRDLAQVRREIARLRGE